MAKRNGSKSVTSTARRHAAAPPAAKTRTSAKKVARKSAAVIEPKNQKPKAGKLVYYFGATRTEGATTMKPLLGGKGANPLQSFSQCGRLTSHRVVLAR